MEFIEQLFEGTSNYIEVREIDIEGASRQQFFNKENIKAYVPPKDKNIYYGVFGRTKRSGKAEACNNSKVVWADYDTFYNGNSVSERIEEVERRIKGAKLPKASVMVNSGNGLHCYWLLSERASSGIVELNRAIAKATGGDIKATDKARVLRLPNTRNVKDIIRPLSCEVVQADYGTSYDISELREAMKDKLVNVIEVPTKANTSLTSGLIDRLTPDRPCISGILKGVPEGERNFALGRLTKWLQVKGYTKAKAKEIILEWNTFNKPMENTTKLLNDFIQYWKGEYKLLGCSIERPELQQILYKYCNRPECNSSMAIGNIKLENSIEYNNRLLNDLYNITGNDLIVYGLLVRHKEGLTTSILIDKLTSRALEKPCMSKPTRIKSIDTLKKLGFIEIIEGNRTKGKENIYKAIPQGNYGLGFTLLSNGAINGAIDRRVTSGELKIYVLLLKYAFGKGSCYPSLDTLAKELRTSIYNISKTLMQLEKSDYIKRNYKAFNGIEKLDISLLI